MDISSLMKFEIKCENGQRKNIWYQGKNTRIFTLTLHILINSAPMQASPIENTEGGGSSFDGASLLLILASLIKIISYRDFGLPRRLPTITPVQRN